MTDLDRLLDFAARSRVPGGFGHLDDDGRVLPDRPIETLIVARMTHVFGLAQLLGRPGADELVRHGVEALTDGPLRDAERGGWRSSTDDDTKAAYVHAFVVLAGSTAATVGADGGRALLDDALAVWQHRFWDDEAGLAVDEWDGGWSRLSDYRGANANMHGVEATLAAADALASGDPTTADRLRNQALRSTERMVHGFARERDWRLPEHFTADWVVLPEYNRDEPLHPFRPYGATFGHSLEWSRFLLQLDASPLVASPPWLVEAAEGLTRRALDGGWSLDGRPGLVYTVDWDGVPVADVRLHWPVCEGIQTTAVLIRRTGDLHWERWYRRLWDHAARWFIDERGTWRNELDDDMSEAGRVWPGRPDVYHCGGALTLPLEV